MSSLETRIADLASRMPHVPNAVTAPMQTHLLQNGEFSQRGMPAVLEAFYARLEHRRHAARASDRRDIP